MGPGGTCREGMSGALCKHWSSSRQGKSQDPPPAPKSWVSHMRLSLFLACCNGKGTRMSAVWGGDRDTTTSLFQPNSHPEETQDTLPPGATPEHCTWQLSWDILVRQQPQWLERQPSTMTKPSLNPVTGSLAIIKAHFLFQAGKE